MGETARIAAVRSMCRSEMMDWATPYSVLRTAYPAERGRLVVGDGLGFKLLLGRLELGCGWWRGVAAALDSAAGSEMEGMVGRNDPA